MMKNSVFAVALSFLLQFSPANADVSVLAYSTAGGGTYHKIVIHGNIRAGDYDRFLAAVSDVWAITAESDTFVKGNFVVLLNSAGGDALEAMRIGRKIRELATPVSVPSTVLFNDWDLSRGLFQEPVFEPSLAGLERRENLSSDVACYSACFLIYIGALERVFDHKPISYHDWAYASMGKQWIDEINREDALKESPIGIHRPFFERAVFSGMSSAEADKKYREMEETVRAYLRDMGLGERWISEMFAVPSNEIKRLTFGELSGIGRMQPSWEEWLISKCGFSSTIDAVAALKGEAAESIRCILTTKLEERGRRGQKFFSDGAQSDLPEDQVSHGIDWSQFEVVEDTASQNPTSEPSRFRQLVEGLFGSKQ